VPAYVISEVEILDETLVDKYKPLAKESINQFGGDYLVRDAVPEALEGSCPPGKRLVVVRFNNLDTAHRWYASTEYKQALAAANGALDRRLFVVEGLAG